MCVCVLKIYLYFLNDTFFWFSFKKQSNNLTESCCYSQSMQEKKNKLSESYTGVAKNSVPKTKTLIVITEASDNLILKMVFFKIGIKKKMHGYHVL